MLRAVWPNFGASISSLLFPFICFSTNKTQRMLHLANRENNTSFPKAPPPQSELAQWIAQLDWEGVCANFPISLSLVASCRRVQRCRSQRLEQQRVLAIQPLDSTLALSALLSPSLDCSSPFVRLQNSSGGGGTCALRLRGHSFMCLCWHGRRGKQSELWAHDWELNAAALKVHSIRHSESGALRSLNCRKEHTQRTFEKPVNTWNLRASERKVAKDWQQASRGQ